jgi:hypothetical protein
MKAAVPVASAAAEAGAGAVGDSSPRGGFFIRPRGGTLPAPWM